MTSSPSIPDMIEAILARDGQTQAEFATRIGTTPAQISRWRTGKTAPQAQHAGVIRALYTSVPTAQAIAELEAEFAAAPTPSLRAKERMNAVHRALDAGELGAYAFWLALTAIEAHDAGQSQAAFILERMESSPDQLRLDREIDQLRASGWWPWD